MMERSRIVHKLCVRSSMRWRPGVCGIVGAPARGTEASFDVNRVMTTGKRIIGIIEGDSVLDLFIPSLVELYRQ